MNMLSLSLFGFILMRITQVEGTCVRPGCGKPSWNGLAGEHCSKSCKAGPSAHGALCVKQNCGKPSFNGKPGEYCSKSCMPVPGNPPVSGLPAASRPPKATCQTQNCGKPTWNGNPNEYCSKGCKAGTTPQSQTGYQAPKATAASIPTGQGQSQTPQTTTPKATCQTPGCGKQSWNGKAGEFCSKKCKTNQGLTAPPPTAASNPLCIAPGCGKASWNGKAGEYCSQSCKKKGVVPTVQGQSPTPQTTTTAASVLCRAPGCGKQSWNGKAGEYCTQYGPHTCNTGKAPCSNFNRQNNLGCRKQAQKPGKKCCAGCTDTTSTF